MGDQFEKMNSESIRILLIDDDEDDYVITKDLLADIDNFNYSLDWEMNFRSAYERIIKQEHDIYLIDYQLGESNGIALISQVVKQNVSAPLILLTGKGDKLIDIQAMKEGASDFLVKGTITPQLLERTIRYTINNNKALQLLKESENKFRQLFERSIDAIYISDLDHTLIDVNPSLSKLLKYSHEEILTKNISYLFAEQTDFYRYAEKLKVEGHVKSFDVSLSAKDGQLLACQLTSVVRTDHSGMPIGYQGIIHDLTLRKKTEEQLLIAEKLSMTGKIARSIAHEVRNPLTNLGLALDQLQDELPPDNEDALVFIDIIKRNSGRIGQLITEMLNSSKPKELYKEHTPINRLIDEALDLIRDRITLKNMKLIKRYSIDDGTSFYVDGDKLKVALVNVLVNAIEAMSENEGQLLVEAKDMDDMIRIEIADNGKGISREDLPTLFDPFYTKKHGGMGLGLTSTQNIIHSHGGSIEVNSELGEGTSFIISLPCSGETDI